MRTAHAYVAHKQPQKKRFNNLLLFLDEHRRATRITWHAHLKKSKFSQREHNRKKPGNRIEPVFHHLKRRAQSSNCNPTKESRKHAIKTQRNRNTHAKRQCDK